MASRRPAQVSSRLHIVPAVKGPKAVGSRTSVVSNQENQAPAGTRAVGGASSMIGAFKPGVIIPPPTARDLVVGGTYGLNVENRAEGPVLRSAKIPESRQPVAVPEKNVMKSLVIRKPNIGHLVALKVHEGVLGVDSFEIVDMRDFLSREEIAAIPDPDIGDEPNETLVIEYVKDITVYLLEREIKLPLKTNYLQNHEHIAPKHRRILVNWLLQVHAKYKMTPETLYIMCYIIDSYVSKKPGLPTSSYQLIGGTALWIASKFEEIWPAQVEEIVRLADDSFKPKDIITMEQEILQTIAFNFNRPTPITFLRRYSKIADVDTETHCMAKFLLELTLTEYQLVGVRPSKLAAAALYLSMKCAEASPKIDPAATSNEGARGPNPSAGEEKWTNQLAYYAGYPLQIIMPVVHELCAMVKKAQKMHNPKNFQFILDKYSTSKFYRVSCHPFFLSDLVAQWAARAVLVTPEDPKSEPKVAPRRGTSYCQPSGSVAMRPKATAARGRSVLVPKVGLDKRPPFRP